MCANDNFGLKIKWFIQYQGFIILNCKILIQINLGGSKKNSNDAQHKSHPVIKAAGMFVFQDRHECSANIFNEHNTVKFVLKPSVLQMALAGIRVIMT